MSKVVPSLLAARHLRARMTSCSWDAGWRSVLLRSYVDPPVVDGLSIPATHDFLIVLVTRGHSHMESKRGGRWRDAQYTPGCIGMTAPGETSELRWRGEKPHETLHLHLPAATLRATLSDLACSVDAPGRLPSMICANDPVVAEVMRSMASAYATGSPDLYAETASEFLIVHILNVHGEINRSKNSFAREGRVRRAEEMLNASIRNAVTLGDLAREAGLSKFHFLREFKHAYGETPSARLRRLRMDEAKRLLQRTNLPITEIAAMCGYENPSHFATTFKQMIGTSPTRYRGSSK